MFTISMYIGHHPFSLQILIILPVTFSTIVATILPVALIVVLLRVPMQFIALFPDVSCFLTEITDYGISTTITTLIIVVS